ncbi:oligoribonuclease [mine drainage metagenome]|uniref:Oligoribonuclease n=1 Tax=mine drainage metagenome TaxID=410659 RepID=T0ZV57_9ZZZZ
MERVRASPHSEASAELETLRFLEKHVPAGLSPMCGNSICQDRRFLARWMPRLEAFFHYRNLDVSTLKELARRWNPGVLAGYGKESQHTALADVLDSIAELDYYRRTLWRP